MQSAKNERKIITYCPCCQGEPNVFVRGYIYQEEVCEHCQDPQVVVTNKVTGEFAKWIDEYYNDEQEYVYLLKSNGQHFESPASLWDAQ